MSTAFGINKYAGYFDSGVQSFHQGGAQFLYGDGHVGFLTESTDQDKLEALTTRNGGEPAGTAD